MVEVRNVVDQAQVLNRIHEWHRRRVDLQRRKWKDACGLPLSNGCFDLRRPHEIRFVRRGRAVSVGHLYVVVRTADLVLGAVAAGEMGCVSQLRRY